MAGVKYNVDDILAELRLRRQEEEPSFSRSEPTYRFHSSEDEPFDDRSVPDGMMDVRPIHPQHLSAKRRMDEQKRLEQQRAASVKAANPLAPDTTSFSLQFSLDDSAEDALWNEDSEPFASPFGDASIGSHGTLTMDDLPIQTLRHKSAPKADAPTPTPDAVEKPRFQVHLPDTMEMSQEYETAHFTDEQPIISPPKAAENSAQTNEHTGVLTREEAVDRLKSLKAEYTKLWIRGGALLVILCVAVYLAFSLRPLPFAEQIGLDKGFLLLLPDFAIPEIHPRGFIISNLVLALIGGGLSYDILHRGIGGLLNLRANSDTPASLSLIAALIQSLVLLLFPEQLLSPDVSIYIPLALGAMWFTILGRILLHARVYHSFQLLCDDSSDSRRFAFRQIEDNDYSRPFLRGFGPFMEYLGYNTACSSLTDYFEHSYTGDYSDNYYRASAPMSIFGGLMIGGVSWFLTKEFVSGICAFSGTICICAPFSSGLVPHIMLHRVNKWLNKKDSLIAGYDCAQDLSVRGVVMLDEKDLYGGENVHLDGMKVFSKQRVDEAILDAASVVLACDGVMGGAFFNMIGGNTKMLRPVDGLLFEDGMGISAWVDKKRVLIGNRELMKNHGVPCPSADFEARHTHGGKKALYVANSGEISTMFAVSYTPSKRTVAQMQKLEKEGLGFLIYTTDPNLTQEQMTAQFGLRKSSVRVLPTKLHKAYRHLTEPAAGVSVGCVHGGGVNGIYYLIHAAASVCRSVRIGSILQLISIIVGYGFMALLSFTKGLSAATFSTLGLFGLCAFVITIIGANFGKT